MVRVPLPLTMWFAMLLPLLLAADGSVFQAPVLLASPTAACFTTTEGLEMRLSPCTTRPTRSVGAVAASNTTASVAWQLSVDDTQTGARQPIDGFGAAWTDATVAVFDTLSSERQDQLLQELFGDAGIGLSFMRHTIGQSDLTPASLGRWSFDDNGGVPDPEFQSFNLTEPGWRMLQWIQRMRRVREDVLLVGSPWSPPGWLKTAGNTLADADVWVEYMLKYLRAYHEAGVKVDAVTPQNEPLHSDDPAWTMLANATQQSTMVAHLSAALKASELETQVWAFDHNTDRAEVPQLILDTAGRDAVGAVAWHCYSDTPGAKPEDAWPPMSDFHVQNPEVKQYMTECWTHLDSGESFFHLPGFIGGPVRNYASGALAWTLGGSTEYDVAYSDGCAPCSGLVQVDVAAGTVSLTQDYYTLGHFSKFVQRGATFHTSAGSGGDSGSPPQQTGAAVAAPDELRSTAFVNPDGGRVVVLENQGESDIDLYVSFASGDSWSGRVAARSISTWVVPGPERSQLLII